MSQPVRGPGRPPGPGRGKGGRSTSGVRPPKAKRGVEVVVGRPSVSGVGHPPGFRQGIGTGNTPGEDEVLIINSIEDIKFFQGITVIEKPYVKISKDLFEKIINYYPMSFEGFPFKIKPKNLKVFEEIRRKHPLVFPALFPTDAAGNPTGADPTDAAESVEFRLEVAEKLALVYKIMTTGEILDHQGPIYLRYKTDLKSLGVDINWLDTVVMDIRSESGVDEHERLDKVK